MLSQCHPEELRQIEVVDDASTDADVETIVKQIGKGRVNYFRQEKKVGSLHNSETCLNRSKGQLVHLLHGDDLVSKGYYSAITALFEQFPEARAAFSRYCGIDERVSEKSKELPKAGLIPNWLLRIDKRQQILYAAITVRREVNEKLGGFYSITYGKDWEMWVRIARSYPIACTPETLAAYRKHSNSITSNKFITGEHLEIFVPYHCIVN
ncbi:hypothetical protein POKO110462_20260 [Pontibacter korlensis]